MGCWFSCCQDDTRKAERSRIVPMGQEFSHYEHPSGSDKPEPQPADRPQIAGNPYSAQTLSVVVRMNQAEQNAGNFKVGCDLDDSNVITKVKPGTPGDRGGLLVGDQVIKLDGEMLDGRKVSDVLRAKALHTFTILRSGK
mmetsp:Transcript_2542/g.4944  ORF Transcript_2542/g.4944 Transcript_2542/m.4944 type:complete len:140 (-) Transcript_2542:324-743(-)